ncbi:helix-turn-helix domain-containing protein [Heliobacterium gestii]|uniref:Helix-turn-helix domain-containing protein n=1 Tax=Heliomicrobium gestii TaxID=2699 RepID=A0A845LGG9_HELGE|nr:AraC family transcriptional regulator [Heliomicrobium gestii]MBM7868494.1 AraC family transcriptional regulator [Heliomicrobium gestii]MZP44641.1 helix-turn-helix domain-containing protein [Heliomicrobium gestii]
MDALKQVNLAMKYIEANLAGEIDFSQVARLACCSEYHFKRMFSFLSGYSLSEYIRRRRLALAASELQNSNVKVIDLAVKYGYDSPDSFTRAFQALHGVNPTEARKRDVVLKAFPPMTFQLIIKGGNEMDYRIVEKDAFQIAGIKKRITLVYEGVNTQMNDMWSRLTEKDFIELKQLSNVEPRGVLCVSANFTEDRAEGTMLDQYIGVATTQTVPERWTVLPVDASAWAVFTAIGEFPKALQDVWAKIYSEWFPTSGYELTGGPEILWNESKDTSSPNYKSEIWIPVIKK